MTYRVATELGGRTLSLETGKVAKQADGAVWVQYADTIVLVTAVASKKPDLERDFFPLSIDYREKDYAAGKIPGNVFKREGRPKEKEILSARLIDHHLRPLFPAEIRQYEVQIMVTVLSGDQANDADVLGMIGASAALSISDIPFMGPTGAVRVGKLDGELTLNPTFAELAESEIDVVMAGTRESLVSIEGSGHEACEDDVLAALAFGHETVKDIIALQERLVEMCGRPKRDLTPQVPNEELVAAVRDAYAARVQEINRVTEKESWELAISALKTEAVQSLEESFPGEQEEIEHQVDALVKADMRRMVLDEGRRVDGRGLRDLRPIACEVSLLPRAHGSALFTRGQTQCLAVTTLGTKMDERLVDDISLPDGKAFKSFMLDYNMPPFSGGEVKPIRGPSRREIGHGALAEKAIEPVIPGESMFPYTVRVVSDVLECNSSTSMATVCAGSLSLMDAGVPIKAPVAGIGVGLVKEGDRTAILTDILGAEDHLGDMDLKIAGTKQGVTSIQMDIKIAGITLDVIREAFERSREARLRVLDIMDQALASPRSELSQFAPRILFLKVEQNQIGTIIGPGGKQIREIEETGAKVNIEDDGTVVISSVDAGAGEAALAMIRRLVQQPEIGEIYEGTVKKIAAFGAFVEILPGKEGLVHISELEAKRVEKVEDVLSVGDRTPVKVIGIDEQGKIKLSRKAVLFPQSDRSDGESPRSQGESHHSGPPRRR